MVAAPTVLVVAASTLVAQALRDAIDVSQRSEIGEPASVMSAKPSLIVVAVDRESDLELLSETAALAPDVPRLVVYDERARSLVPRVVGPLASSAVSQDLLNASLAALPLIMAGCMLVPQFAMRDIAAPPAGLALLGLDELEWLKELRRGTAVGVLAASAGYSERSMHRRLHEIYERLDVAGRHEAFRLLDMTDVQAANRTSTSPGPT